MYALYIAYLLFSANQLPNRVAVHFNFSGYANGWLNRATYLQIWAACGAVTPLCIVTIGHFCGGVYDARQGCWLGALTVLFFACMHFLIMRANTHAVPRISLFGLISFGLCFICAFAVALSITYKQMRNGQFR
jgi:hypothetical protein